MIVLNNNIDILYTQQVYHFLIHFSIDDYDYHSDDDHGCITEELKV